MKPCLKKPEGFNPYYVKKPAGYSPCDYGNKERRDPILNTLANCVGWATGRYNEIGGYGKIKYAPRGNASNFINDAKRLGLKTVMKPTLGGIMVWKGGRTGQGHVAVVEVINSDGSITTSESEYNGRIFSTYRRSGANWTNGCAWMKTGYTFIGCIVNDAVEEEDMIEIKDIPVKDATTGEIKKLKGIYVDGRNYIQLSDLSDNHYAIVGWDGTYPLLTEVHKCNCNK